MRLKTFLKLGGMALLSGSLAACGNGNNNNPAPMPTPTPSPSPSPSPTPTPTPTPTPVSFQSAISPAFAAVFNASATSDPVDPTDASVPALAPASDPVSD